MAEATQQVAQEEIEALLRQAKSAQAAVPADADPSVTIGDVEFLLAQANVRTGHDLLHFISGNGVDVQFIDHHAFGY